MKTGRQDMLKVYGIKNCDTMKKAIAWLDAHEVIYEFIDYKKAGVVQNHLPDWNRRAGWQRLLNTKGMMWKRLSDEERTDVDESRALALMTDYPTLIKRPVADTGGTLLIGFDDERYAQELKRGHP
ncbi:arsenate reductase [Propionivibrio sp.]|uniref:arsenate reductase n=1 Tax=Propionivibrio sp. TaxID=2212460 RepID=UPI0025CC9C12|nr:arsenate reductase [Propionivibrio sp.]